MSINELKQIIASCVNDVYFNLNGKKCGITSQVKDYTPTYECWCGNETREYSDVYDVINDPFFDGQNLINIIEDIEIFVS